MFILKHEKTDSKVLIAVLCGMALVVALLLSCYPAYGKNTRFAQGKLLMNAHLEEVSENAPPTSSSPVLFLIGENHARVKAQKQLVRLLEALLDAQCLDAILVESGSGPIDISTFLKDLRTAGLRTDKEAREFWLRELDWGRIAGYEFVYVVRHDVPLYGVEDMRAKYRFTSDLGKRGVEQMLQQQQSSNTRGVELIHRSIRELKAKSSPREVQAMDEAGRVLDKAAVLYERMTKSFLEENSEFRKLVAERAELLFSAMTAQYELRDVVPSVRQFNKWIKDFEARRQALLKEVERLERGGRVSNLERMLIESKAKNLKSLGDKIENYHNAHGDSIETLAKSFDRLEKVKGELEPWESQLENAQVDFEDSFYRVANILMDEAENQSINVDKVRWFFANETSRLEQEQRVRIQKEELRERDVAMVRNTLEYLKNRKKKNAVLIVGYAHLEGIKENLQRKSIAFVSGKLPACEEKTEPWEIKACSARRLTVPAVFAEESPLLPETRFRQKKWLAEIPALLRWRNNIGKGKRLLLGNEEEAQLFEDMGPNKDLVVVLRPSEPDLNTDYGEHILEILQDPKQKSNHFLIVDREATKSEVDRLSNDDYVFVYLFPKIVEGKDIAQWYVHYQGKTQSWEDFSAADIQTANGGAPKQIVFVEEVESPIIRKKIQNSRWTQKPSSEDGKRRFIFTNNAKRAMKNLGLVGKQGKSTAESAFIVDDMELNRMERDLRFTTKEGENSHMVIFIAKNTAVFREKVKKLAKAGLLRNKQVGLVTCGNAFQETALLRGELLRAGCAIVWIPGEMIRAEDAPQIKQQLIEYIEKRRPSKPLPRIDLLMDEVFLNWKEKDSKPPYRIIKSSAGFVWDTRMKKRDADS